MIRQSLLNLLTAYNPIDAQEIAYKNDIIAFINNNPQCFERSLEIGHITASAWLLNRDHNKALLMHHAKLDIWVQLGGHCDGDSQPLNVAIKEVQEESGIMNVSAVNNAIFDVDVHLIPANSKEKAHYHYDIRFLLQVNGDEDFVQNAESKELRWFGKDATLLPTKERSVVRMFYKWLAI